MSGLFLLPPASRDADAGVRNVRLLSILRSLAIGGQFATILTAAAVLGIRLPLVPMLTALAVLLVLNLVVAQIARHRVIGNGALFATMLVDVACLTAQLYLAGGLGNPFVGLYLLQVVIAALLLPAWASGSLVVLTAALYALLVRSPFHLPVDYGASLSAPYAVASWFSYVLAAGLVVLFVSRIVHNLAEREARLAALRERAAEEEHVVRIGLLASGAAHELGTPLASLAVMLNDWARDPAIRALPDVAADVDVMAGEIARCKRILGDVLLAAGEIRADAPTRTTLREFVTQTIDGWRGGSQIVVDVVVGDDGMRGIVADRPLAQAIVNLLENAADAGARRLVVDARIVADQATLSVTDDGRGFARDMLARIGNPYSSTKPRAGAGLGLFLASNVLRTLGGSLIARNKAGGGAEVTLVWPLGEEDAA